MRRLYDWTPNELAAFLEATSGTRLEAAWHLVALGGLRIGELLGLRWRDVDLDARRIEIRDAVVGVPYAAIKAPPNSRHARTINLDPRMVTLLHAHLDRQQADRGEWGSRYRNHDLVVCDDSGRPFHPRRLSQVFAEVAEQASLPPIPLPAIRRSRAAVPVLDGALA